MDECGLGQRGQPGLSAARFACRVNVLADLARPRLSVAASSARVGSGRGFSWQKLMFPHPPGPGPGGGGSGRQRRPLLTAAVATDRAGSAAAAARSEAETEQPKAEQPE
jgi:hypothetical protein